MKRTTAIYEKVMLIVVVMMWLYMFWYIFWPRSRWSVSFEKDDTVRVCLSRYRWDGVQKSCSSPIHAAWFPEDK